MQEIGAVSAELMKCNDSYMCVAGWVLVATADGDSHVSDPEQSPRTCFVPSKELLPSVVAFCRGCAVLFISYISVLHCLVQLEGISRRLLGLCLVLLALHCLVLYQVLSSFTFGLWHAEALDQGRLLSSPLPSWFSWAFFVGFAACLLAGTLWISAFGCNTAVVAVLVVLALHALQLDTALSALQKWREPQIKCEEFHQVNSELLPHSNELPAQLSRLRFLKLALLRCFMGCLVVCAAGVLGLVTLDGSQVRGELVDYSFNRGHLLYPSEGQTFHNTVLLDNTVDSLVLTLEAGPNTIGIQLKVQHSLLPENETFYPMDNEKSGEFQVFLPASPLYGRISVVAVGHHASSTYVFHALRSGAAVKVRLQGAFSPEQYPDIKSNFGEERRLQYLQKHPRWFIPDLDREANGTFYVEFSPVIYAPLVSGSQVDAKDAPKISTTTACDCGGEEPGFGNKCELEELVELADGSAVCLYIRSTIQTVKLTQNGSIASESDAMAEWLTGLSVSGKSAAFVPWAMNGDRENSGMLFFHQTQAEKVEAKQDVHHRLLKSALELSMPWQSLIGKPAELLVAPTSDPTDSETKAIPLQVISHAPPIRLTPSKNLVPAYDPDNPQLEYAYCSFLNFHFMTGEIDDERFQLRVEERKGGTDCRGRSIKTRTFKAVRTDAGCKDWCKLYTPWAETFDVSLVVSPDQCLKNAVKFNSVMAIDHVLTSWLGSWASCVLIAS